MSSDADVIVIGAGLAGLSTALYLQEQGYRPLVLEARPVVGGRTSSWNEDGMEVESGLHRYLGFYTELPKLLRMGGLTVSDTVAWEDTGEMRLPGGPRAEFGVSLIHRPLKTIAGALGNNRYINVADKMLLARFLLAGLKDYATRPEWLDTLSVEQYAHRHDLGKKLLKRILTPVTDGLFFQPPPRYSAYALFGLIGPYAGSAYRVRVGAFRGGMSRVMSDPLAECIKARGGRVVTSSSVKRIKRETQGFVVQCKKASFKARAVVLAASPQPAQQIVRDSFAARHFSTMMQLATTPSVSFQLELSEPSLPYDRVTFGPGTALASFSEQSRTTFTKSNGRLSIILSQPNHFIDIPAADIYKVVLKDAKKLGIDLKDKVQNYKKVVIPHDFYLLAPGSEALRPRQLTPEPGFFLAGDYTKQPYLATMEGAVFSGRVAAELAANYIRWQR